MFQLLCAIIRPLFKSGGAEHALRSTTKREMRKSSSMKRGSNPARPGTGVTNYEIIRIGGAMYVTIKGKWEKSPLSEAQMRAQEEKNWKTAKNVSCKYLRDESVNGQSAAVYNMHSETENTKADTQIWISKSKGLILRQEEDVDIGHGDKSHYSTRYEYNNVQTPAVSP